MSTVTRHGEITIDGVRYFRDLDRKEVHTALLSVKGGDNVGPAMVKDLIATVARDKADIGLFITLAPPTKAMLTEAAAAGFYTSPNGKKYARLQLLTIAGLLDGTQRAEHPDYEPDTGVQESESQSTAASRRTCSELPGPGEGYRRNSIFAGKSGQRRERSSGPVPSKKRNVAEFVAKPEFFRACPQVKVALVHLLLGRITGRDDLHADFRRGVGVIIVGRGGSGVARKGRSRPRRAP